MGWDEIRDLAGIRRTVGDRRRVAGVAGGLARHLDIDPLIVRVAFVVLTFFGGAGLVLYIACWLLVPEEGSDWARVALDRRSRTVALVARRRAGAGDPARPHLVGQRLSLGSADRRRHRRADRHRLPAARPRPHRRRAASITTPAAVPPPTAGPDLAAPPAYVEQPRPVNPRKKGPILFWFALAVMAVGLGVLGVVDLAGASVAPSAYPALVLALSGVFLLLGAFWGRAGGLILVGLLAAGATVGATIGDQWDPHRTTEVPAAARPRSSRHYHHRRRRDLVVDLTGVRDPPASTAARSQVSGDVGHLEIRVPTGRDRGGRHPRHAGPAGSTPSASDGGGVDTTVDTRSTRPGPDAPRLTIDADLARRRHRRARRRPTDEESLP